MSSHLRFLAELTKVPPPNADKEPITQGGNMYEKFKEILLETNDLIWDAIVDGNRDEFPVLKGIYESAVKGIQELGKWEEFVKEYNTFEGKELCDLIEMNEMTNKVSERYT